MEMHERYGLSRRSVLGGATLLAGCASVTATRKPLGIQLYTVRAAMEQDLPGTLRRIAEIGYDEVEFAGYFGTAPGEIKRLCTELGISAPSVHVGTAAARDTPAAVIDTALEIGHRWLVIPHLGAEERRTLDQYRAWADMFNSFGARCRTAGLRLAYHNHDFEFVPIDGVVPYDLLMERCDRELVKFELDLYWARKAAADTAALLARDPGRFPMCHVKDMSTTGAMADVGAGVVDFAAIFAAHPFEHYFVERDDAPAPLETATASYAALNALLNG
jgi:sugar phosphate isomerase/epimerase